MATFLKQMSLRATGGSEAISSNLGLLRNLRFVSAWCSRNDSEKMGREGVEPSRCYHRQILSLLRLPIPPSPRHALFYCILESLHFTFPANFEKSVAFIITVIQRKSNKVSEFLIVRYKQLLILQDGTRSGLIVLFAVWHGCASE